MKGFNLVISHRTAVFILFGNSTFNITQHLKSSHLYLYSAFNNTNCVKATAQYQNSVSLMENVKNKHFSVKGISLLNSVMSSSISVQFK